MSLNDKCKQCNHKRGIHWKNVQECRYSTVTAGGWGPTGWSCPCLEFEEGWQSLWQRIMNIIRPGE